MLFVLAVWVQGGRCFGRVGVVRDGRLGRRWTNLWARQAAC